MGRHGHLLVLQRHEGPEVGGLQHVDADLHDRQIVVRIDHGAAVAGHVLHDRQHAAGLQPVRSRLPQGSDGLRIPAIGAIADHVMDAFHRHVQHGQAIDGNAEAGEIERVQARHQPGGAQTLLAVLLVERADGGGIRIGRHERRADALHAASLLIDQHGGIRPADAVAHGGDEIGDLRCFADVPAEENEAPGPLIAEEGDLVFGEGQAFAAGDESFRFAHDETTGKAMSARLGKGRRPAPAFNAGGERL